jgi:hypothetical protein
MFILFCILLFYIHLSLRSDIRFANKRYAPGTPAGNSRKKLMPV